MLALRSVVETLLVVPTTVKDEKSRNRAGLSQPAQSGELAIVRGQEGHMFNLDPGVSGEILTWDDADHEVRGDPAPAQQPCQDERLREAAPVDGQNGQCP